MSVAPDFLCFSHLRWDHVFQRPNHLMTRAARDRRVFYIEEPIEGVRPSLAMRNRQGGVIVATPMIPTGLSRPGQAEVLRDLVGELVEGEDVVRPVAWYETPMALPWSDHLDTTAVVYDCMDELSGFRGAPTQLGMLEQLLLARADVVFTGGRSLYEAKRSAHRNVHAFPSSVDVAHFGQARSAQPEPQDQRGIPHPRLGFFGVIDERMNLDLVRAVAERRPDWHLVLVGPIAKIDAASIPRGPNVHLLGPKPYDELPAYLAGWDVALMPFAHNEATRYISPTKTPEYLAGGKPVVATSIHDVVDPWGRMGLVHVADEPETFVAAVERALETDLVGFHQAVDSVLADMSWDRTWQAMMTLIDEVVATRAPLDSAPPPMALSARREARRRVAIGTSR